MTRIDGLKSLRALADPRCIDCAGAGGSRSEATRDIARLAHGWHVRDTYTLTACMCTGSVRKLHCTGVKLVTEETDLDRLPLPHDVAVEMFPVGEDS